MFIYNTSERKGLLEVWQYVSGYTCTKYNAMVITSFQYIHVQLWPLDTCPSQDNDRVCVFWLLNDISVIHVTVQRCAG